MPGKVTPYALAVQSQRVYSVATHRARNAEALIEIIADEPVLTFRGTEKDFGDILTDLRFFPWYSSDLRAFCHKGFLRSTQALYPALMADAAAMLSQGRQLHVTGHSLGAAQGTIFACMLRARGLARAGQITLTGFGSPPPQYGNGLNKWLRGVKTTLYQQGSDCVPRHPAFGSHVAELTKIGPDDGYDPFRDHRIAQYIEHVWA